MRNRSHFYVTTKSVMTWLMALCLLGSAVTRIVFACWKGTGDTLYVWSQIVLPVAACLLFVAIALASGKEFYYKTAIPVWMTAIYFALAATQNFGFGKLVSGLFWIAVIFYAMLYTVLVSGWIRFFWLMIPVQLVPLAVVSYLYRADPISAIPSGLFLLGMLVAVLAVRMHPFGEYHPTWGDRSDGRRIRTLSPMSAISSYFMVTRNTSSNFFEESLEVSNIDRYIRAKRREGLTNIGIMHVILAAYCRGLCKYPGLNRFLAGQRVYSHGEDVIFCLTVKKEMAATSPDTVIKVHLKPTDTIYDVYEKLNAKVEEVKNAPLDSTFDNTAGAFNLIPGLLLKFTIWLLKLLDYFGLLPRFLLEVSPFHGSIFLTSMGSLGIPPIYHHLYDFGNLPVFGAFGCKRHENHVNDDGTISQRKYVDVKFVLDERICDGYYYAAFFKHFKRLLAHPEVLDTPPAAVAIDIE